MTWKHVAIVVVGCLTACFGAWVTLKAPAAVGGPMLIALGGGVVTGALGHAGQGRGHPAAAAAPAPELTPLPPR